MNLAVDSVTRADSSVKRLMGRGAPIRDEGYQGKLRRGAFRGQGVVLGDLVAERTDVATRAPPGLEWSAWHRINRSHPSRAVIFSDLSRARLQHRSHRPALTGRTSSMFTLTTAAAIFSPMDTRCPRRTC